MSARFKPYLLIITAILLATFLLNAPVACATKLAKACNIFDQHKVKKDGSCQALLPGQNSFDIGIWSPWTLDLEVSASLEKLNNLPFLLDISAANFQSLPIRC
jgi:hypothetical protein